jgi:flagellar biogenesis protein FliO
MVNYLINFAAYTLAMVGVIFLCLVIYKKFFLDVTSHKSNQDFLKVEYCISLSPRKSVYVLRAGNEKFLIAADIEQTSFLAKLETSEAGVSPIVSTAKLFENNKSENKISLRRNSISAEAEEDKSNVRKLPVMRELLRKLES